MNHNNIVKIQHMANNTNVLDKSIEDTNINIIEVDLSYSRARDCLVLEHDPENSDLEGRLALSDLFARKHVKPLMLDLKVDPKISDRFMEHLLAILTDTRKDQLLFISSFNHYFIRQLKDRVNSELCHIKLGLIYNSCFPGILGSIPKWVDYVCINKLCYLPEVKSELYSRPNLLVFVYTVNHNNMIPKSKIDGIISDHPNDLSI